MTAPFTPGAEFKLGRGVLEVTSNTKNLRADLRRGITTATKGEKIVLPVELDRDLHRELQASLKKATAGFDKIELGADASEADKEIEKLRGELAALSDKKIGVDIDPAEAIGEITRIRRELDRLALQSPTVKVRADTATAVTKLAALELQIARINDARIEPKIDRKIGSIAANDFAQSFSKDVSTALSRFDLATPISGQVIAAIGAVAALAPVAAAGALALGSSLGLAAASSAAALPAFLGAGAGIGGLVLAFSRVKTALKDYADTSGMTAEQAKKANEKFNASLSKLTPAGREFVKTLVGMRSELKTFQSSAEQTILPSFTRALNDVRTLLPDLNQYMQQFGFWTGVAVEDMGAFAQSPVFRGQLKTIMGENVEAAKMFSLGLSPVPGILTSIAEAASPLVPRFATAFESGMRMLDVWIETRRESGQLADFFTRAGDEASKWGQIVGNTVVGVARLFGYASGEGQNLSSSLLDITQRFREWSGTESARNGVISTFEYMRSIDYQRILAVASAVGVLSVALKGFGLAQGVAGIASSLASLGPVGLVIGVVALAVTGLAAAFGYLYVRSEPIRDSVNGIVSAVRDNLSPVFDRFRLLLSDRVAPAVTSLLSGALGELKNFLVSDLLPAVREAYDRYLPSLESAFDKIVGAVRDNKEELRTLLGWGEQLLGWVVKGIPRFASFAGVLVDLVAGAVSTVTDSIGIAVDTVDAIGDAFSWVGDKIKKAWSATSNFFKAAGGEVSDAARGVGDAFSWIGDKVSGVWGTVTGFVSDVFGGVINTARDVRDTVTGVFDTVYDKIVGVLSSVWGFVSPIFSAIGGVAMAGVDIVKQIFTGLFDWVDQVTGGRITGLINTVSAGIDSIGNFISSAAGTVSATWSAFWDGVWMKASWAWSTISDIVSFGVNSVRLFVSDATNAVSEIWNSAMNWVSSKAGEVWDWVAGKTSSALNSVRGTVRDVSDGVKMTFSAMWDVLRAGWNAGWDWLTSKANSAVIGIKSTATGIRDGFVSAINSIPRGIVGGLNAMVDVVNGAIGTVNKILPDRFDLPAVGHISVPAGYAGGGRIVGAGTGTSDDVPIMASNGEFVLRARAVSALQGAYGAGFLDFLNAYDVSGDPGAVSLRPRRYADGGLISTTQNFIRSTVTNPYVFGAVGPGAYDCSGLAGEVWARLTGHPSFNRYFTTENVANGFGFQPGHGTFTVGVSPTHMVGNLGGLGFEAKGSSYGILVGPGARSVDSMPRQYYLPSMGDQFYGDGGGLFSELVGKAIDRALNPVRDRLPRPGGLETPLIHGLFEQIVSGVKAIKFDQGGPLDPGLTLSLNRTGRTEQVLNPQEIADLKSGARSGGVTYRFEQGSITLDASKIGDIADLVDMVGNLVSSARRFGG